MTLIATDAVVEQLFADAEANGWVRDTSRNAPQGKWVPADTDDTTSEFTVTPPYGDLGIACITAHTDRGSLRLSLVPPVDMAAAVGMLRAFLGWTELGASED